MQLNENIRQCRKDKRLTQEYMAVQLNMTQPNYFKLENRAVIDDLTLVRIARALDIAPDMLRSYHRPPKPVLTPDDYRDQLLCQKDETIRVLQEQVQAQKEIIADLRERLVGYLRGGANEALITY